MTEALHLAPPVLHWAALRAGSSLRELAKRVSGRAAARIEQGELTVNQAMQFAREAGVPFGYLFLSEPPAAPDRLPIADFRTMRNQRPLSRNFLAVYHDIEFKQAWYREYLQREAAQPLAFVGRYQGEAVDPIAVGADIRASLSLDADPAPGHHAEETYADLASRVEAAGVLVFKSGIVGNHTRRKLSVTEFRGFVITDDLAPAIFVNGADAPAAWSFTLMHELAHLWLGQSGVSDAAPDAHHDQEALCNAIAAEILVPQRAFQAAWSSVDGTTFERIARLQQRFRVSRLVLARQALALRLVGRDVYDALYASSGNASGGKDNTGGDFYLTLAVRNSKSFSRKVAALATCGRISFREAGQLLNTNPNNVAVFHERQQTLRA